ncbi:hypothetical protein ACRRTK_018311 [Alexandromys fortis]
MRSSWALQRRPATPGLPAAWRCEHRALPRLRTAVRPPGGERHRCTPALPTPALLTPLRELRVLLDRRSLHWAALGCVGLCLRLCSRPGAVNVSGNWRAAVAFA